MGHMHTHQPHAQHAWDDVPRWTSGKLFLLPTRALTAHCAGCKMARQCDAHAQMCVDMPNRSHSNSNVKPSARPAWPVNPMGPMLSMCVASFIVCVAFDQLQCCTSIKVPHVHGVTTPLASQAAPFHAATDASPRRGSSSTLDGRYQALQCAHTQALTACLPLARCCLMSERMPS